MNVDQTAAFDIDPALEAVTDRLAHCRASLSGECYRTISSAWEGVRGVLGPRLITFAAQIDF